MLAELLRRIAKQEARHVAFYASQARDRLAKSKKAQVLARFALKNAWGPVGSSIMPPDEVTHVMGHLFAGEEGLREIRKLDEHISRMPGLDGLNDRRDLDEKVWGSGITGVEFSLDYWPQSNR